MCIFPRSQIFHAIKPIPKRCLQNALGISLSFFCIFNFLLILLLNLWLFLQLWKIKRFLWRRFYCFLFFNYILWNWLFLSLIFTSICHIEITKKVLSIFHLLVCFLFLRWLFWFYWLLVHLDTHLLWNKGGFRRKICTKKGFL